MVRNRTLRKKQSGGFYPSVMGKILMTGPYFMSACFMLGSRLFVNDKTRMSGRMTKGKPGKTRRYSKRKMQRLG
jgi:hypothetical protein